MSQKLSVTLALLIGAFALSGCSRLNLANNAQGALQVTANDTYSVYLNETHVGQTPFFDEKIKTGEYLISLVPANTGLANWQTRAKISDRTLTVVDLEAGPTTPETSSQVIYLEELATNKESRLSISTIPDNVVVKVDGQVKGFSPLSLGDQGSRDLVINLEIPGYKSKILNVKTNQGYHLVIQAQLARGALVTAESPESETLPEASSSAQVFFEKATIDKGIVVGASSGKSLTTPYVKILEASTGIDWLRVRSQAVIGSSEVARVKVNTFFPVVEINSNQTWIKINYFKDKTGWIQADYVEQTGDLPQANQ